MQTKLLTMENINTLTLGEIVKQNYKAAAVFERHALDFCCNGHQTFADACDAASLDPDLIKQELAAVQTRDADAVDFDAWPLHMLIDYIQKRHHAYVEEMTPQIKGYLDKISVVHGDHHPELKEVRNLFYEIGGELAVHMKKEELLLFPFIKKIEKAKDTGTALSPLFKSVTSPINMMKADHADEGEKFQKIGLLTDNYKLPGDACNTYSLTYRLLGEFEKDLHLHIHLENNILFPKAIAMEEEQHVS